MNRIFPRGVSSKNGNSLNHMELKPLLGVSIIISSIDKQQSLQPEVAFIVFQS